MIKKYTQKLRVYTYSEWYKVPYYFKIKVKL